MKKPKFILTLTQAYLWKSFSTKFEFESLYGSQWILFKSHFQKVVDIRVNIENIQKYVNEVKKLHSTILAAPNTDDSEFPIV